MTAEPASGPLSRAACESIARDVLSRIAAAIPDAKVLVNVASSTADTTVFAANDALDIIGAERVQIQVSIEVAGRRASAVTDRRDEEGLAALLEVLRQTAQNHGDPESMVLQPQRSFADPPIHFAASLEARAPELQGDLVRRVIDAVDDAKMTAAGSLRVSANARLVVNTIGLQAYSRGTYAELSVNARTPSGRGSGWAWGGHEDFSRIEPLHVTGRAVDLARRSDNPVAIEPGRYTVILEPGALAQLLEMPVFGSGSQYITAQGADLGISVFSRFENKKVVGNKLGLQMADRRVQLFHDPLDPRMPFSPLDAEGRILTRTHWIEDGVLKNLAYGSSHARRMKRPELPNPERGTLEVEGPAQTLEEMIASTRRGVWVHRFSSVVVVSPITLLLTGVTRDGTFLIENGKVSKAVKNLRFAESPFFILNKIEAAGEVVRANASIACPRLKVRDFEFTALSDAI